VVDIFAEAGLRLEIEFGAHDLPANGDRPLNRSQLHEAFSQRGLHGTADSWLAHVLIVPAVSYQDNGSIQRPYGVMYDFGAHDLDGRPREGCAIAYARVRCDDRLYLRTLAHELGHVFNLLHPSDDDPPQPIGTTVMNRTVDLRNPRRRLGRFPENIAWEFSARDREWLSSAPDDYVRPGGQPYGARPADWSATVRRTRD